MSATSEIQHDPECRDLSTEMYKLAGDVAEPEFWFDCAVLIESLRGLRSCKDDPHFRYLHDSDEDEGDYSP